ncbi:MAG: HD domain-containing protein [Oscillospiraceae bacterium]|nr:HD domain-containing protein [Oscillospiraceae bacterium]
MAVLFACYDEKTTGLYRRVWSRHQEDWNQRPIPRGNDGLLEKALRFALDHAETSRDADRPALLHALQTLQLLASMNADNGLLAAGVLCDLPRQGVPLLDLYEQFGPDVAALVHALEQRGRSWYTGRLMEVTDLPNRPIREKMLVLAEKTAALKQMAADYSQLGDELWKGFELPKEMLSWYYSKLNDGLEELADHPETAGVYWEMTALFKDLFVTFYLDEEEGLIWQISMNGERRMLRRGRLRWGPMEQELTENARPLHRKAAERIEDNWSDEFWAVVERDCADGFYDLFSSESRSLLIEIHEGELIFHAEDRGDACKAMNGERAYDFHYALDADNTRRLMMELRIRYGLKEELPVILRAAFGSEDGPVSFRAFCDEAGVRVQTISF